MDYLDEEIIELKNKKKHEEYNDIYKGIYIDDKIMEFEEVKLFDEKMSIMLPKEFVDMPSNLARIKYPCEGRPQIIKTDLSGGINFTFSMFESQIKKEQIEGVSKGFKSIIKKMNPANMFFEEKTDDLGESKISWFDYKGFALDGKIYTLVYVTSINGRVLHGIFNCKYDLVKEWKPIVRQVIMSIKDLTIKER